MGHRTYLATKVKGENSMFGKAEYRETINWQDRQDPDGTVNTRLREAKYPNGKDHHLETMVDIQGSQKSASDTRADCNAMKDRLRVNASHGS